MIRTLRKEVTISEPYGKGSEGIKAETLQDKDGTEIVLTTLNYQGTELSSVHLLPSEVEKLRDIINNENANESIYTAEQHTDAENTIANIAKKHHVTRKDVIFALCTTAKDVVFAKLKRDRKKND